MRISSFLLFFCAFGVIATTTHSQNAKVKISNSNLTIGSFIDQVEGQTDYLFVYSKSEVDLENELSVRSGNKSVSQYLKEAFDDSDVNYAFENDYIVLTKKAVSVPSPMQQGRSISGVIVDELGDPVIGANVIEQGTLNGIVTDFDGNFVLTVGENAILRITYIGYMPQEIRVGNQSTFQITLIEDTKRLDEVIIVGYGVQKKANVTGSVAQLNAEAFESRPISSISSALAGQIPGVTAVQTSGAPGSQNASITIRGKNSINAASPLVIVDGVPGSMNTIDPHDIESLTVLKDAASAAIYGVQAANGVILITTKKGTKGQKARINYSGSVAWGSPVALMDYLGAGDYAMLYNEAVRNENPNAILPYTEEDILRYRDGTYPNTDWYKETFKSAATETYHHVSINGGTEKTNYNASLGYTLQNGLVEENKYERFNIRTNIDSQINNWLSAGLNVSGYRGNDRNGWDSYTGIRQYANRLAPVYPVYNEDGSFFYSGIQNPVAHVGSTGHKNTINQQVFAITHLSITPFEGLNIRGQFSVKHDYRNNQNFKKALTYGDESASYKTDREGSNEHYNWNEYQTQILVNYMKSFGNHSFALLGGFEQWEYLYRYTKASREQGGNDELGESLNTLEPSTQKNEDGGREEARRSYFGRVQYDYLGKYLFEANLRGDASSRFPKDNRWGYFPAFSAAWRITEENFVKDAGISWLSNLKLRLGWGKTGNQELKTEDVYSSVFTYAYEKAVFNNELYPSTKEARYVNNHLKWATVTNYEAAIEAGFLDNRLGFELAVYNKVTNDMLLYLPVSGVLGMDAPAQNAGSVKNTGFDLSLFHNNQLNRDFRYNINFNMAYVKNRITDMKGTEGPDPNNDKKWFLEGQAIGSYYGYKAIGFFNTEKELATDAMRTGGETLGDIKYLDVNKDGKIDAANDRMVIGKEFPSWTGGVLVNLYYKDFDFSMFWQGAFDVQGYYTNEAAYSFFNNGKVMKRHLDRWTPENHNATYPRITKDTQINYQTSSFWLQNASYARLKNISIGYTIPRNVVNTLGIENIHVSVSGENVLTFTKLDGLDPEQTGDTRGAFYPNLKKISLGLRVTF